MTHINSREYIDSKSVKVSDKSENESGKSNDIFAGIFSVLEEKKYLDNGVTQEVNSEKAKTRKEPLQKVSKEIGDDQVNFSKEISAPNTKEAKGNHSNSKTLDSNNLSSEILTSRDKVTRSNENLDGEVLVSGKTTEIEISNLEPSLNPHQINYSTSEISKKAPSDSIHTKAYKNKEIKIKGAEETVTQEKRISKETMKPFSSNSNEETALKTNIKEDQEEKIYKIGLSRTNADFSNGKLVKSFSKTENNVLNKARVVLTNKSDGFSDNDSDKPNYSRGSTVEGTHYTKNKEAQKADHFSHKSLNKISNDAELKINKKIKKDLSEIIQTDEKRLTQSSRKSLTPIGSADQKNVINSENSQSLSSNSNQQNSQQHSNNSNFGTKLNDQLIQQLDLRDKNVAQGIMNRLENAMKRGLSNFELNLRPKNLGKLKIGISIKNNTSHVKILTETHSAALLLGDSQAKLSQMMDSAGLRLVDFSSTASREQPNKDDPEKNKQNLKNEDNEKINSEQAIIAENQYLANGSDNALLNVVA